MINKIKINNLNLKLINIFCGDNGIGKSHILKDIEYLSEREMLARTGSLKEGSVQTGLKPVSNNEKPVSYYEKQPISNNEKLIPINKIKIIDSSDNLYGSISNKLLDKSLKILNKIVGNENIQIVNLGLSIKINDFPNYLSTGHRKIFNIISATVLNKHDIILIDDIECNIFYKYYDPILNLLFNHAINNNTQLFITTHSKEILSCIEDILEGDKNVKDNFCFHSLFNDNSNKANIQRYDGEEFLATMKTSVDIRE